jgi:predicted acylesterase/phospholipase RssA
MCSIFVCNDSEAFPLDPQDFLRPSLRLYLQALSDLPVRVLDALQDYLRSKPGDLSLTGALASHLPRALPPSLWDNSRIERFLNRLYNTRSRTNNFRQLKRRLYVVTMNLDTGETVRFGACGNDHVPISKAVQASTAVPGLFPPVQIDGRYYLDGGVKKTVHASTALEAGADLLLCVNPLVSFNARQANASRQYEHPALVNGGLPVVLSQTVRTLLHSRMRAGIAQYARDYPDRDLILFEPNACDADMFFSNIFSFGNRVRLCEHAYQTTRRELLERYTDLQPMLARHGIALRLDVLRDRNRHFDTHLRISPEVTHLAKLQNPVTNRLSEALDRLKELLQEEEQEQQYMEWAWREEQQRSAPGQAVG